MGADGKVRLRPGRQAARRSSSKPQDTTGSPRPGRGATRSPRYWTAVGVKTTVKQVERTLYETHCRRGQRSTAGRWGMDRNSIVMADPGRYTGTDH